MQFCTPLISNSHHSWFCSFLILLEDAAGLGHASAMPAHANLIDPASGGGRRPTRPASSISLACAGMALAWPRPAVSSSRGRNEQNQEWDELEMRGMQHCTKMPSLPRIRNESFVHSYTYKNIIFVCVYTFLYLHLYVHACMHACMHACVHTYICKHTEHACMHACMHACIRVFTMGMFVFQSGEGGLRQNPPLS